MAISKNIIENDYRRIHGAPAPAARQPEFAPPTHDCEEGYDAGRPVPLRRAVLSREDRLPDPAMPAALPEPAREQDPYTGGCQEPRIRRIVYAGGRSVRFQSYVTISEFD